MIHSGSTLLTLMLGGHSRFIGLGEVAQVIKDGPMGLEKTRQVICSCGQKMEECVFWSRVAAYLVAHESQPFEDRYQAVLDMFGEVFGAEFLPIDSAKSTSYLRTLKTNLNLQIKVLYIIRDVRSFTISHIDNMKRKEAVEGKNRLKGFAPYIFGWWYRENRRMQQFFAEQNIPTLQIGYEELCLYPHKMTQLICDFLEIPMEAAMLSLKDSHSHVIRGNRMRYQPEKSNLLYDHRWFLRSEWMLPAMLFPNIMRYNAREVYRNHTETVWKQ